MRTVWIVVILAAIILSLNSPMIPHWNDGVASLPESNIENITRVDINLTDIKERAINDNDFSETLATVPGLPMANMTIDNVIIAERSGGQIWLSCISRIDTNKTVHYKWTRIVDGDSFGGFGKAQEGSPGEEEFAIGISNITGPTRTASINCTLSVLDLAGNEQTEQKLMFLIS